MDVTKRVTALRRHMAREGIGAAVVLQPAALHYLTGFRAITYSRPIILTLTPDRAVLIVPGLEEVHAGETAVVSEIPVYYEHPEKSAAGADPWQCLLDLLREVAGKRDALGVQADALSLALSEQLSAGGWRLKDVGHEIVRMRAVKDAAEIALIRRAGELCSLGVARSVEATRPGMSQLEIDLVGNVATIEQAARTLPGHLVHIEPFTAAGEATAQPHLFTPNAPVEKGQLIIHNRQVAVDGYRAECERTYALGALGREQRRIFETAVAAQQAGIAAVRPGIPCAAIDDVCREIIRKAGYAEYFIHRTGHGLGLEEHEAPYLRWDNAESLTPGMVFSVEPGIYMPGVGGARHSDTVLVTETGGELLTDYVRTTDDFIF